MHLEPGLLLGGRYALEHRLAGGGMGEVWQACDRLLDRPVAVKVPRPEIAADPEFARRLLEEARHAAAVVHPGIAAVFDVHAGSPVPYLVLELVEGRPLSHLLADEGALPPERARHLVCQVAAALAAAHDAGLVHRDVKPSNLIVTPDDTVKVTDFGIARAADSTAVTRTGFVGTAQYLSPEQAAGRPASAASDLYALGVVAHELLTGSRPFDGEPLAVLLAHREQPVPELPAHVPADLRALVASLLDKDPDRRPTARQVVGEESTEVDRTQQLPLAGPLEFPLAGPARSAADAVRAQPRLALAGAVVALAVVALVALPGGGGSTDDGSASAQQVPAGAELPPPPPAETPFPVAAVSLFHPGGSGQDHPEEVPLAVDGDPATAWTTQRYSSPQFGNLRPGVGLLLDLGAPSAVREVRVAVGTPGLSLRLHAGAAPDPAVLDSPPLGATQAAPPQVTFTPAEPVTAQFFVLWIDRLPDGGGRAAISEVTLLG